MAIGLCNSIWSSHLSPNPQRMSTFIILSRFLLYLHLYYNHITHLSHLSPTHAIMRSVSSSRNTVIHLSPSHHVITCTLIGYISPHSLTIRVIRVASGVNSSISLTTPYYHTHSYLFVCGNSSLLASLHPITPSYHSLSPHLTSIRLLDHYHLKIDPLGYYTCIIILITLSSSSPTPISLSITIITYLLGPQHNRIMDIGYISLS
jgi:hypothetical protein